MNYLHIVGKVNRDAISTLVDNNGVQTPLVSFILMDTGMPYTKSDPLFIQVDFMREPAMHLFPYLKKGKDVVVWGILKSRSYRTRAGEKKQKYYVAADVIVLTGGQHQKEGGE